MEDLSPNAMWKMLGAEVIRDGYRRKIVLNGKVILSCAGYDMELKTARELLAMNPPQ